MRRVGVVLHCAACSGAERRRDVARVIRTYKGEEYFVLQHEKNDRGFDIGSAREMSCPDHGTLDMEIARRLAVPAWALYLARSTVQHVAVPPEIAPSRPSGSQ